MPFSPLRFALLAPIVTATSSFVVASSAVSDAVQAAMQRMIDAGEIPGAVTLVIDAQNQTHFNTVGLADVAAGRPMQRDTIFWIASMTKPITAVSLLMLQDEGRLHVDDPVAKHLPEFAALQTPSGQPANLTIAQLLTHTSGLADISREEAAGALTLADLIPRFLAKPMNFEPGTKWQYCQSGINTAARIVEVVSGQAFEVFLEQRLFAPLGMKDTTFFPEPAQWPRLVTNYRKHPETGVLEPCPLFYDATKRDRPPTGNGGLFSTAPDYGRFAAMLLHRGSLDGRRYLKPESVALMTADHTGDLAAGFIPGSAWGLATGLVREPQGLTAMLSPGTFGHGGRDGTQAWIDPVRKVAYVLMIQRADMGNSDASDVRFAFQTAAASALARP